tara:strand:- start:2073 stop:2243 length:171 start_codon:yes stop_codon:yes gene_type:complete
MYTIKTIKNHKKRFEFWIIEKFDKKNQYGDEQMLRGRFYSLDEANDYINKLKTKNK